MISLTVLLIMKDCAPGARAGGGADGGSGTTHTPHADALPLMSFIRFRLRCSSNTFANLAAPAGLVLTRADYN